MFSFFVLKCLAFSNIGFGLGLDGRGMIYLLVTFFQLRRKTEDDLVLQGIIVSLKTHSAFDSSSLFQNTNPRNCLLKTKQHAHTIPGKNIINNNTKP